MALPPIEADADVPATLAGARFDQAAARLFGDFSRERLKQWIASAELRLNDAPARPDARVRTGDRLRLRALVAAREDWHTPQALTFAVAYEDPAAIVIDKPVGLVVHPGAGASDGTLVNGLLHRFPELAALPRAGIVHRLDKDTSGLLVVARTLEAHTWLTRALAARDVSRRYLLVVRGSVAAPFEVDAPIGRHPVQRTRMAVRAEGRPARTRLRPLALGDGATLLEATLETGRTHQIRVHLAHAGHPLLGDPVYGVPHAAIARQALHAYRLGFTPASGAEPVDVTRAPPPDFLALLAALGIDGAHVPGLVAGGEAGAVMPPMEARRGVRGRSRPGTGKPRPTRSRAAPPHDRAGAGEISEGADTGE